MTREQIIKQAANKYLDNYVPGICGMCLEDIWDAFIAGAEWANKHPDLSSLWHDASEEPKDANWKILCQDRDDCCWVEKRIDAQLLHQNWNEYTEIEMIVRWAYIKDLLPKGCRQ